MPPSPNSFPVIRSCLSTARPSSTTRNPRPVAQSLATLKLMEQRGSGFARMRDAMLNHGLDVPTFAEQDGYFVVTFPGPNGDYERLKVPEGTVGAVPPAVEAQLNERQKKMLALMAKGEALSSQKCVKLFGITRDTSSRDFDFLVQHGLAEKKGAGRATRYVLPPRHPNSGTVK